MLGKLAFDIVLIAICIWLLSIINGFTAGLVPTIGIGIAAFLGLIFQTIVCAAMVGGLVVINK